MPFIVGVNVDADMIPSLSRPTEALLNRDAISTDAKNFPAHDAAWHYLHAPDGSYCNGKGPLADARVFILGAPFEKDGLSGFGYSMALLRYDADGKVIPANSSRYNGNSVWTIRLSEKPVTIGAGCVKANGRAMQCVPVGKARTTFTVCADGTITAEYDCGGTLYGIYAVSALVRADGTPFK